MTHEQEIRARAAYAEDVARRPKYHDGSARKAFDELGPVERWSWGRDPVGMLETGRVQVRG